MIWLTGSQGMLGRQFKKEFRKRGWPFIESNREVDIGSLETMRAFVSGKEVDWIVNCAAYTAVDRAESEVDLAFAVNATGSGNVAALARETEATLIHFSTDYVFDGRSAVPYRETDAPGPLSVYGKSKLEGERHIGAATGRHFILRISWLYGVYGASFVRTMLARFASAGEVRVVDDQRGAPTYAARLAENVAERIIGVESDRYGLYHYTDEGNLSWYDFAVTIREAARERGLPVSAAIRPIPSAEYPTAAARPASSALDKSRVIRELRFRVFPWRSNLDEYFQEEEQVKQDG